MDDEQVDDLLMPEEDETSSSQMYEHFRFVADKGNPCSGWISSW